jgi:hypothetical protein
MDPLDPVRAGLDATRCGVCDGPVSGESTEVLAHRDGLAFLRLDCSACGSTTLAFVDGLGHPSTASDSSSGLEGIADPGAPALTPNDVLDMHQLLEAWHGGLVDLLAPTGSDAR